MADEKTRQFVADMLAKGHSKEDIFAALDKVGAREPYHPTQYGGRQSAPSGLGPSTEANQWATKEAIDKRNGEMFPDVQESDYGYAPGATDEQKGHSSPHGDPARGEATSDPIAAMVLSGALGAGAGAATAGAGRFVSGMTNGVTGAVTGGSKDPMDIFTAGLLGVAGTRAGEPEIAPPRTQRDIDSVGLARAGNAEMTMRGPKGGVFDDPAYRALPEGEHGTNVLADRAMQTADSALEARGARASGALDAAEAEAIQRNAGQQARTDPLLQEIRSIQQQQMGPGGPLNPEAHRRLEFWGNQLSRGGQMNAVDFAELNAIRKAANDRLSRINGTDMGRAGDEQAAGMLSRAVRRFDETGGYVGDTGGVPQAVDGAETAVMQNPNFSPQGQQRITPENGYRALGGVETPTSENMTRRVSMDDMPQMPRTELVRPQRFGDALDAYAAEQEAIKQARGALGEGEAARNRVARLGSEDQSSPASAVGDARKVEQAGRQIPEAMPFIDQIRARNIAKRRGDFVPPNLHGGMLRSGAQFVRHNVDNARFRLNPPKAVVDLDQVPLEPDMTGSIPTDNAPWGIEKPSRSQLRADQLIPLELQLMLMQQDQERQ